MLFMVFNFAACAPVWLCVGMFSIYHLWLISGNTTTIERWEKDKVSTLVRRGKIHAIKFPYNLGFMTNMRAVLGPNPLTWMWPQEMQGTGLSFPVNPEAGGESIAEWAGVIAQERGLGSGYDATTQRSFPLSGGPPEGEAGPSSSYATHALQARLRGHLSHAPADAGNMV